MNIFSVYWLHRLFNGPIADYLERITTNMLITKDQILAARGKRKTVIIDVPEWFPDGQVLVMEMSGKERDAFDADMISIQGNGKQQLNLRNVRAKLVAKCIVNPADFILEESSDGRIISATLKLGNTPERVFNDIEANDLGDLSATALERVFSAAQELSGITKKDIDELTGDLKNDRSVGSGLN